MPLLPIVERELRVSARHPASWWRRDLVCAAALVILLFAYVGIGHGSSSSLLGRQMFSVMSGFGLVYALLAGPLATVDCLGRERRDGTLGLLFLTDLRSHDVVFGKMAAASLDILLGLTAAMPVVALPILMGGVGLTQFALVVLMALNLTCLSLATGVCASALFANGRTSLAVTLVFLTLLTLGLPLAGEQLLKVSLGDRAAPFVYMCCPLYGMNLVLDVPLRPQYWRIWLHLAGTQALVCSFLLLSCMHIRRAWRDLPASAFGAWCRRLIGRVSHVKPAVRRTWRERMLAASPIAWLEGRERLQSRILWALILLTVGSWLFKHIKNPGAWPDGDGVIVWPMFTHYIFCIWIAIDAPRRFADDRKSGALELLLCTPLAVREIIRGGMLGWWRKFGLALLVLMAWFTYSLIAHVFVRGGVNLRNVIIQLGVCGAIVVPLQAYAFGRIGLYQGLVHSSSLRATFMLIWKTGLLPWVLFIVFLIVMENNRRMFGFLRRLPADGVIVIWTGLQTLVFAVFLAHANWRLKHHFRALAAQSVSLPWWRRLMRRPGGGVKPQASAK